jgi:transglutaminase-like putative cysteine protease
MRIRHIPDLSGTDPGSQFQSGMVTLPEGTAGIRKTTGIMRALIHEGRCHPKVRSLAVNLTLLLAPRDRIGEIESCFNYVRDYIRYVDDVLDTETLSTPDKIIEQGAGDCDDKTILLCSLLESIGTRTCLMVAGYNDPGVYEHVYCAALLDDSSYIPMDATQPFAMGWQPQDPTAFYSEVV